ncbi:MAG TPA: hypothetical protein VNH18_26145 [Bryobacteraceae bacterium]|nr:hypothetical protein [Bryobacteraceae bacterium]HXJ42790.1 hypothetical protein [Bryobacteraceae bacterium]
MRISAILFAVLIGMSSLVTAEATTKNRSKTSTGRSRRHKKSSSRRKHTTTPKSGNVT